MREMPAPTSASAGRGLSGRLALVMAGRFSGGSRAFVVGTLCPEASAKCTRGEFDPSF
jgi:dihydroxy-acid dehydratase